METSAPRHGGPRQPPRRTTPRRVGSPHREEWHAGADGVLNGFNKRIEWLDIQIASLAGEVLKAVTTVGIVQDLARRTEARVTSLEGYAGGRSMSSTLSHQPHHTDQSSLAPIEVASSRAHRQDGEGSPSASAGVQITLAPVDSGRADVVQELDARLKESFQELNRWQTAVEGVVRQIMTESSIGHHSRVPTHVAAEATATSLTPAAVGMPTGVELGQQSIKSVFGAGTLPVAQSGQEHKSGSANLQHQPLPIGAAAEATLQQLEADFAKLRLELKESQRHTGANAYLSIPSVSVPSTSAPGQEAIARGVAAGDNNHVWSRSNLYSRPAAWAPDASINTKAAACLPSSALDVDSWRDELWRKSPHYGRAEGDISRLYDELMRLEEEEVAMRKPRRDAAAAETAKIDGNMRRRPASCSNLAARKARVR